MMEGAAFFQQQSEIPRITVHRLSSDAYSDKKQLQMTH